MPQDQRSPVDLSLLATGEIEVKGRMPWSSNHTFLVQVSQEDDSTLAVYKPGRGERPLWDFAGGLYRREAAAFALSEVLGWGLVPETLVRDGPLGEGSVQRFVPADFSQHYFTLFESPEYHDRLRTVAAFDLVANNADRKSGHCLLGEDGAIFAIDNGLCFHPEPHLRTVIWEFGGEELPGVLVDDLAAALPRLGMALADHLSPGEVSATVARAEGLLARPRYPEADLHDRPYPWPLV